MSEFKDVSTSVGLVDGNIVLMWDSEVDCVAYNVDAAEELATKIMQLVTSVRKGGEPVTKD